MNESKKKALNKLKTARGQIDGIIKMLEDERYCVDISTQILSVIGLLKKANIDVLNDHIRSCVTTAILEGEDQGQEKIDEVINIIDKYIKYRYIYNLDSALNNISPQHKNLVTAISSHCQVLFPITQTKRTVPTV